MREIPPAAALQRSLVKRFRKELWQPFVAACKRYALVPEGARVAAATDGTSAALLSALLLQELHRHSDVPFTLEVFPLPSGAAAEDAARAALARGCGRAAVPDCMSDVTEFVLTSMLRDGVTRALLPREKPDADGLVLIRPLYCVEERDIRAFCRYNGLPYVPREADPRRRMARELLDAVRQEDRDAEIRVFRAVHALHKDTFPKTID